MTAIQISSLFSNSSIKIGLHSSDTPCNILFPEIRKVFDAIDEDGNGKITKNELERLLVKLNKNATKTELNKMFQIADKDGNNINSHCPTT